MDEPEFWNHRCASIDDVAGWHEVRIGEDEFKQAVKVSASFPARRAGMEVYLASIAKRNGTRFFHRYFFENRRDMLDFKIRFHTIEIAI